MNSVPLPRTAIGALVMKEDRVLLVRRRNPPYAGYWSLPGGKQRPGESLQTTVLRELHEETGLTGRVVGPVNVLEVQKREQGQTYHYVIIDFLVVTTDGHVRAGDDALQTRWFTQSELEEPDIDPHSRRFLKRWLAAGRPCLPWPDEGGEALRGDDAHSSSID